MVPENKTVIQSRQDKLIQKPAAYNMINNKPAAPKTSGSILMFAKRIRYIYIYIYKALNILMSTAWGSHLLLLDPVSRLHHADKMINVNS